jgi:putative tryptophan/tyrosine transport system substrate-binding protein
MASHPTFAPGMPDSCGRAGIDGRQAAIFLCLLLLFFAGLAGTTPAWAAKDTIAVIYPDIGPPYRGIFEEMINGVEDKVGEQVAIYAVNPGSDIGALKSSLLHQNTRVVIALGQQGMKTAMGLSNDFKVVAGGVLSVPESQAGGQPVVSLTPDPALLLARMKSIMPAVKRVFVVYDPAVSDWLIKLAKASAHDQGLELVAYQASNLRSAVKFYQQIFSEADGDSDALWLPQDATTVEDSSILPLVLQESWNQSIPVFSSNFSYVRRGILFSLYPDNVALGASLARLAQGILLSGDYANRGMTPLRDVKSAVNLRTAKHLGLKSSPLQRFDTIFPDQ